MLTKHDERKMPKNLGHIASLADTAINTLAGIMMEPNCPPMARVAACGRGPIDVSRCSGLPRWSPCKKSYRLLHACIIDARQLGGIQENYHQQLETRI